MRNSTVVFLLFYGSFCLAQEGRVLENRAILFSLNTKRDTIDFIVADTTLRDKKPVFLWCQGSLPVPLFCEVEGMGFYFFGGGISNFNYRSIVKDYHLVVISMPKTPVLAKKEHLNGRFQYIPNPGSPDEFSKEYTEADFLDNYVGRAGEVLAFLKRQNWVDNKKLVVAGHSQGSKVATKIAVKNRDVTHLGLFSANPFGRTDQYVRQARLDAQLGKISWAEADSIMNETYEFHKQVQNPDSIKQNPALRSWKTFSEPFFDDWLNLDIPVYLAYGTEDRTSDLCDIIPLFFIETGKRNLTMKRYLGLEHNFFEVSENGKVNYDKGRWEEVMKAFLDWIK